MKVITGATLIDGTGRDPVTNASIAIDDEGRISEVGRLPRLPRGAEVIDAAGRTVMPGLIDCHVHLFIDIRPMQEEASTPLTLKVFEAAANARATLDGGVTTVRDAGGAPLGFKLAVERGLIPGPRTLISVLFLSQTGGHGDSTLPSGVRLSFGLPIGRVPEWPECICDGVDDVRRGVRSMLRAGADFIKMMTTGGVMSPSDEPDATQFAREEISAMVQEAHAHGKTCMSHAQGTQGIRNAVECGVESIEHGVYLDEPTAAEMARRGTFLVPTLQAANAVLKREEEQPGSVLPQSLRKVREILEVHTAATRMAIEMGVKVAMGTDAGVGKHGTNAEEVRLLVETGMTPMQAIVAATKTASECVQMA
ncbi:MAG: amidohydrolase family protein, partial [Gemmatimonadetes bacterium]|nr:amidohydrolase family protein [Gemmatimonadota bacterium]